ncbi:MAG: AAA family ATPase [Methylotenera sp.]|nr:AAA family ATPase [Methylotenera sp.]MDP2404591.1 AAA family ATPase [Methylotenera sp.]MDP3094365.1 AAA family ATPase [Methylotenera sp.]MDZ4222203.1 AAA family ATPase [Methylotenera sp.]
MILKKLFVQNFRCFEQLEIEFDSKLTVIVADNGVGKTTVLDAIAAGFGRILTKLPKISGIASKESDIRIDVNEKRDPFLFYWLQAEQLPSKQLIEWGGLRKRDSSPKTLAYIKDNIDLEKASVGRKQIDAYANLLIDAENDEQPYVMPVIAYYGTNRALLEEVKRRRNFRKEFKRFDALSGALEPNARFKMAFEWFNSMEDLERRRKEEMLDFNYRLPELETIRMAIENMLIGFHNPRTEIGPLRFVLDQILADGTIKTFRVTQLSDGYRVMLGLVIDLARRMVQANPHLVKDGMTIANPLDLPAIVLIDEIDLHLHPKWQQRVIGDLQRTFPGAQFIVTTHSPQVLSMVRRENIRIIGMNSEGEMKAGYPLAMTYGKPSGDVMHSVMMVDPQPPIEEKPALQRLTELVDQGLYETDEVQYLMQNLIANLGEHHPQLQRLIRSIQRQKTLRQ